MTSAIAENSQFTNTFNTGMVEYYELENFLVLELRYKEMLLPTTKKQIGIITIGLNAYQIVFQ